jgi:hypothetical protein
MQVAKKKTGKEVWECLKSRFVGADRVRDARLQTLKSEFDALRMREDESIDSYAGKLTAMSMRYSNFGGTLDDVALVKKMFDTMPERFIQVIAGIEQFYDLKNLVFEEAVGRLKAFEERIRPRAGKSLTDEKQVLLTQAEWEERQRKAGGDSSGRGRSSEARRGRGRGRGRGQGGGRGNGQDRDGGSEAGKKDKSHIKCFKCKGYGHYANRCPGGENKEEAAHHARAEIERTLGLMYAVAEVGQEKESREPVQQCQIGRRGAVNLTEEKVKPELHLTGGGESTGDSWYLDNGASNHMTGDPGKFMELDGGVTGNVKFGDGAAVQIEGKGSILFKCRDGAHWLLRDVYYIPKLKSNLVSLGQLTEFGCKVEMDDDVLEVFEKNPRRLLLKVQRSSNKLYRVDLKLADSECLMGSVEELEWLWHGRLGHVNFRTLKMVGDREMVGGVPVISQPDKLCHPCLAGNRHDNHFQKPQISELSRHWR